ncbi:hypothetical protein [Corynebacterium parakroppenstedtii]|uniref:hypothetical protein n=1 Tax=Corynebacterium parakroppenstedtii TaxID=2828363 RepID=UPI001C8E0B36|nr:hypothetical protein [Corynebacterium parakroppenstedtii]MBY0788681.1 hypothetical protein [Corynebacterium parakroppenstedtii]
MGRHANKHARSARDESSQRWFTNRIEQADSASRNDAGEGEGQKNSRRYSAHQSTSRGGKQVTVAELLARGRQGSEAPSTSSTTRTSGKQDADARGSQKTQGSKPAPHTPRTLSPEELGAPQRYIPERARSASTTRSVSTRPSPTKSPTFTKNPAATKRPAATTESDKRAPTPPGPKKPAPSKKPDTSDSRVSRRPSGSRPAKSSVPVGPSKRRRRHSVVTASIGVGVIACALFGGTFAAWQSGVLGVPGSSDSHNTASNTANDQNTQETGHGGDGNKQGGSTHHQGDGEPKGDQEVRLSTIKNRPTTAPLPDDAIPANAAAIQDDEAGQLNLAYTGSDSTPAAFAVATRRVFAQQYVKTLNTNMTVDVKSPVSGRNIAMNCRDNGGFVTCEGPDDERVYIQ